MGKISHIDKTAGRCYHNGNGENNMVDINLQEALMAVFKNEMVGEEVHFVFEKEKNKELLDTKFVNFSILFKYKEKKDFCDEQGNLHKLNFVRKYYQINKFELLAEKQTGYEGLNADVENKKVDQEKNKKLTKQYQKIMLSKYGAKYACELKLYAEQKMFDYECEINSRIAKKSSGLYKDEQVSEASIAKLFKNKRFWQNCFFEANDYLIAPEKYF